MTSRIEIQDLDFVIEGKQVLHRLSLSLSERRIGVVGRNGSGKSTLARLVAGLTAPTAGKIRINGHDLAKDRRRALQEVGILFQNPEHQIIFPTVGEEIAFGLEQQGYGKAEAASATASVLERFNLGHWKQTYVNTLSQGQKHLVCLMSVVAMAPRLLVLDEPFAGLDIPTKAQLNRYLRLYQGSLLHITHDPSDLAGYEHLIWLDQGRVQLAGPQAEVMSVYQEAMHIQGKADDLAHLSG
ncbi:energy-coupling factor ABC transporter ATP-binding protein [Ruegeria aquimaris]|uniref:Energy-coupling factor ABC transporter ATP-binding protein n=1 Tax=Ruegeria aquimaris TaxID=2984333 RepID=A0ABT3ARR0_9RHOB|nr:ABC transporter ATP-binding protein [Ruegeria sp. XHP0148]MCV2891364.1 energy-coupling factor ABC transporter ATP-binding protein [Ruegeria sp. XHP0148]